MHDANSSSAIVEVTRVAHGFAVWVYLVTLWFDGEPFEYAFEVGSGLMSQEGAESVVRRAGFLDRARRGFLNEVHLETAH